jgi:DNA-binding NtrC family response regulator
MQPNPAAAPQLAAAILPMSARPNRFRPRLVLAHTEAVYATLGSRCFRRLGWDVHLAGTAFDARHLVRILAPNVVVLDVRLPDESGWLSCSKLVREHPGLKVVLVGTNLTPENHRFAAFVGAAALVSQDEGVQALIDEIHDTALPAAG